MKKERRPIQFIKKPVYKGGLKALRQFIEEQLQYPLQASKEAIEGTVYLKYAIDYKGKVSHAKVIKGIGFGCDEEAIRLVKLLTFDVPKVRNIKIRFHKRLQIHFKRPPQDPPLIQYTYTSNMNSNTSINSNYNYSIDLD